jgi:hypothetical protein
MKRIGILMLVVFFCFVSTAWPQAEPQANYKIIIFDAPGATLTLPLGPNVWGSIVGHYADASYVVHGFLRSPHGSFTTFDTAGSTGTYAFSLNSEGAITGTYFDSSDMCHGFLRSPHGSFTTFDPTGSTCTISGNINDFGVIGGYYTDSDGVSHGFLRAPNGTITTFDVQGAGTDSGQGTFTFFFNVLNEFGAITGYYIDSKGVSHGFLRAPDGAITRLDVKGAGTGSGQGTLGVVVNDFGAIVGWYIDSDGVSHGFLRAPNGTITTFDVKGAGTTPCDLVCLQNGDGQGTFPQNITDLLAIPGYYTDSDGVSHGFLRAPNGTITTFDVKDAGTGSGQGTFTDASNQLVEITGWYIDANGVLHGFLRRAY